MGMRRQLRRVTFFREAIRAARIVDVDHSNVGVRLRGKTWSKAAHKPKAPSPTASRGGACPRSRRSRITSAQLSVLSR